MQEKASFGALLKRYRLAAGLSQEALAARASLSTRAISDLERGINRAPRYDTLELLVNALSLSPQQRDALRAAAHPEMAPAPEEIPAPVSYGLPFASTRFIGREAELSKLEDYLDDPDCRLLTLIGPGGVGKTRLAYEVAKHKVGDFAAGVYVVPLSSLTSPEYLASTIAERLTLPLYGNSDQKAQVLNALREKHLLLVMDNCEHVLDGIELLAEILAVAPGVKILATSRERLNVQGEWLFPVQGLPFPSSESEAGAQTYPSVQLFMQSARQGGPDFRPDEARAVARICKLVEGLPLAVELAASWVHQMPCERIALQIQHDLDFLSINLRDVPKRHRSTRALFEHSWRLLSEMERSALRKLSVFRGGFDADAAAYIAGASLHTLSALVEKSLVRASPTGRYNLHELLRQFAEEKLHEAGELEATLEKHLDYFVTWAEEANLRPRGVQQVTWYRQIETEHANLRVALEWGIHGQRAETGLRLANALWWFWLRRGYVREGYEWLSTGIAQTEGDTPTRAYAMSKAMTLSAQFYSAMTGSYLDESLRISKKLGLQDLVAMWYVTLSFTKADYEKASELFEQALSQLRQVEAHFELTVTLNLYGDRARAQGDFSRAEVLYQESLDIALADQNLELMISPMGNLGRLAVYRGDDKRAVTLLQQAITIGRELGNQVPISDWLVHLGTFELYRGDYSVAGKLLEEALALFRDVGNQMGIAHAYHCLADLALHQGNYERASRLVSDSLSMSQGFLGNFYNHEFSTARLLIVGKLALAHEDYEEATRLFGAAETLREQHGYLLEPLPHTEYEEAVTQMRMQLETAVFEAAWANGQGMSEAEAITSALGYLQRQIGLME